MPTEPICEIDLHAYVDGELDAERRLQIEAYLAQHPDVAAEVMTDLYICGLLRAAHARPIAPSARTAELARGLAQAPRPARLLGRLRPRILAVAAIVALAVLFNLSPSPLGRSGSAIAAPIYLDEAVRAHQTTQLRARMGSQQESPHFNPEEVRRSTRIRVPLLPADWRIHDVQVLPSAEGPALQLTITTSDGLEVSIFAVHAATAAPRNPIAVHHAGKTVAYWQEGPAFYAVVGEGSPQELDRLADDLEDNDLA